MLNQNSQGCTYFVAFVEWIGVHIEWTQVHTAAMFENKMLKLPDKSQDLSETIVFYACFALNWRTIAP